MYSKKPRGSRRGALASTTNRRRLQPSSSAAARTKIDPTFVMRPVGKVRVPNYKERELGDLNGLAESISEVGLLHPISVSKDGTLRAGYRRLMAYRQLGWTEIPAKIVE